MVNEQQTSPPDSVYSIAENVRRVAGTGTEEKRTEKSETPSKQKAREHVRKGGRKVTARQVPTKKETKQRKDTKETIVVSKETETAQDVEGEYIDIKPGWFWKISTVVLAILVIWAYFFR